LSVDVVSILLQPYASRISRLYPADKVLLLNEPDVKRLQRLFLVNELEVESEKQLWNELRYLHQADVFPNASA
jgi:hypothetical protein